MNKRGLSILIFLSLTFLVIFSLFSVHAADFDPEELIEQQVGIDPEDISDPEDLGEEIRDKYLLKEWTQVIQENKILGPVHRFAESQQWFFIGIFAQKYSLSLTFIVIIILWILTLGAATDLLKSTDLIKSPLHFFLALLLTIAFAHLAIFNFLATAILTFIMSPKAWWARLLLTVLAAVFVFFLYYLEKKLGITLKKQKEQKELNKVKEDVEEVKAFTEGVKVGQKLSKKVYGNKDESLPY